MIMAKGPRPGSDGSRRPHSLPVAMVLILLLAFGLRIYGITFGTPFEGYYWWDERSAITGAQAIVADHNLSSIRLGLYPLVLSTIYYPLSVLQTYTWNPRAVMALSLNDQLLVARALSAMAGTALVGLVYLLGRRLSGHWCGLAAALLTAASPTLVAESRYATTGMSVTLLVYLAMLPLTYRRISIWVRLFLCSMIATLAALTKSNGVAASALIPLALLAELVSMPGHDRRRVLIAPRMLVLLGTGVVGLLVALWLANPNAVLEFWNRATAYARIHRAGASPAAAWQWILSYEWGILFGGLAGAILGILGRARLPYLLLMVMFSVSYGLVVSFFSTLFVRWLMVILPGLAVLAGIVVAQGLGQKRTAFRLLAVGFLLVAAVFGTVNAAKLGYNLLHDARIAAWAWVQAELPAGAKIAVEQHALPNGEPVSTRFRIQPIKRAIDQPAHFYRESGFHYLLIADDMYDRWQANPQAHPEEGMAYEALYEEYVKVASFRGTLLHAPPAIDILVLQISDGPVYAIDQLTLGAGWHGEEDAAGTPHRWMTDRGQVFYDHSGGGGEKRLLSFDAYVFRDKGDISAVVNGQPGTRLSLEGEAVQHVEIPLELVPGLNSIELVSERGCGRPVVYDPDSQDTRCISIKVGNLRLESVP